MRYMGVTMAIGAGIGVALFAATGEAWWIGVGTGVGVSLGVAFEGARRRRDGGSDG